MRAVQLRRRPTAPPPPGPARVAARVAAAVLLGAVLAGCAQAATGPEPERAVPHPWAWEMPPCAAYHPDRYAAPGHRVSVSVASDGTVTEVYEPGWGTRAVAEIRDVVATCGHFEAGGAGDPAAYLEQNTVVQSGFAAEESLLVETVRLAPPGPPRTSYAAVVRDGDVVVTLRTDELGATETLCLAGAALPSCPAVRT